MPIPAASDVLAGLRVLDLSRVRAGPACVRQLADWGADVVKIEPPPALADPDGLGGPRHGPDFQNLHRNKRSLTLNLKAPEGREAFLRLARAADVVVENFRPGVMARLGLGYEALSAANPRLILASISGFGQDGPYASRPGFDQVAQGMGGLMSITGEPGRGPMRVGIPVADLAAGILAAQGILLALIEREKSGRGQWVQTSLLQAMVFLLDFQAARYLVDGEVPGQAGNDHPTMMPMGVYPTEDRPITIAVSGQAMWERFCACLGRPEMAEDPRFATAAARSANRAALNAEIAAALRGRGAEEWVSALTEAGVPAGPINDIAQVFADPQVRHLGLAEEVESPVRGRIRLLAQPVRLSRSRSRLGAPPPEAGQHSEEVLAEAGYTAEEIASLRAKGVV
ncbi:MAG: CoA transferase [Acetobacteraceae bacterium]|nr:CoA transferase [Acetobacteraceae bacterium]MDW8398299.1 CoA transferase [Acetobacteraceae bacterium]